MTIRVLAAAAAFGTAIAGGALPAFQALQAQARSRTQLQTQTLTKVQLLALQQQMRDEGCGVQHATGVVDPPTRAAITKCMAKYNVTSGGAPALLAAMNIGFGPAETGVSVNQPTVPLAVPATTTPATPTTPMPRTTLPPTPLPAPVPDTTTKTGTPSH